MKLFAVVVSGVYDFQDGYSPSTYEPESVKLFENRQEAEKYGQSLTWNCKYEVFETEL